LGVPAVTRREEQSVFTGVSNDSIPEIEQNSNEFQRAGSSKPFRVIGHVLRTDWLRLVIRTCSLWDILLPGYQIRVINGLKVVYDEQCAVRHGVTD